MSKGGEIVEFWRWNPGELKVHTEVEFGRYLMRNYRRGEDRRRLRWSAVYKDRSGRLHGFDFVIRKDERENIERLAKVFRRENSGTNNGENGADSKVEIAVSNF
jgi:hypothetical protein